MSTWGDGAADAAVSVTFDNLGEAAQLELGMWPEDVPQGSHFTVVEVLPRLLELLASRRVQATFFVEGVNAEMYPDALHALADAGHEVAVHAWRHEEWAALDGDSERRLLARATDALRSIDLEPRGFRPPGGGVTARTLALLGEHGYRHVSPAGEREGLVDGLAVLPFRWPLVDAYAYLPQFAVLRERYGDGHDPHGPGPMRDRMVDALCRHADGHGGHLALLFHPLSAAFTGEEGWTALEEVLGETMRLAAEGTVACVRMDDAAACMLERPADFEHPPQLDAATWMTSSER